MKHSAIRKDMVAFAESLGIVFKNKDKSFLMKFLSWVLLFNRRFMEYITTVGKMIYFPAKFWDDDHSDDQSFWQVTVHEMVHAYDMRTWWRMLWWGFLYLCPQILALPCLILAFVHSWWWLFGLSLVAPLPAVGRYLFEIRGYTGTIATHIWLGEEVPEISDWYVKQFTGTYYYYMWPFRGMVVRSLERNRDKILDGSIEKEIPILVPLRKIVEKHLQE